MDKINNGTEVISEQKKAIREYNKTEKIITDNIDKEEEVDKLIDRYSFFITNDFITSPKVATNSVYEDFNNSKLNLSLIKLLSTDNIDIMLKIVEEEIKFYDSLSKNDNEIGNIIQQEIDSKIQSGKDIGTFFGIDEAKNDKKIEIENIVKNKINFYKYISKNRYM